jgi:hypothetical protein
VANRALTHIGAEPSNGLAYDRACESVAPDVKVREALANRIIEAAKRGERDLEKLIEYGLGTNDGVAEAGYRVRQSRYVLFFGGLRRSARRRISENRLPKFCASTGATWAGSCSKACA